MGKEEAIKQITELVEKYRIHEAEGKLNKLNEETTKKDFILPLFEALGWNTTNKTNRTDSVTAEENIGGKKADYGFKINGIPKFFLEAKSFREGTTDIDYIKQAVNYAYHRSCTWAVLTDFKEIRVFNAEVKSLNPLDIQLFQLNCENYIGNIDQLFLLSKESFENELIDKLAEKWGKKQKRTPINKQLLDDFTRFREILSKNVLKLNSSRNLTEEDLDESVQRILDRLIFIRSCEDRQIEPVVLQPNLRMWESKGRGQLIKSLRDVFREYDKNFDSRLFDEHLCDSLDIDNEVLSEIISGLYNNKDMVFRYNFAYIEADVLGNIYEQYLGHILRKTDKRAKLKEDHAHRKEQGIYYTPTYIVDYIVKNTLGEMLKDPKINPEKIKILDPACGSGSFLIKAFDALYEHHRKRADDYTETNKSDIVKNHIFGVDLDKQAVEIAQLNLLLKIAEKGHKLPLLQNNIKNGNSLIDDPTISGNKAFNWNTQYKDIMDTGGFDIIIGNPPYVRPHKLDSAEKEFFWKNYKTYKAKSDLYVCFIEKSINLLKDQGLFSFIIPHNWTSLESFYEIRKFILDNCCVIRLVQLPKKVFQDATVETMIIVLKKEHDQRKREQNLIVVDSISENRDSKLVKKFNKSQIKTNHLYNFGLYSEATVNELQNRIKNKSHKLGELVNFFYGLKTGDDEKFICNSQKSTEYKKLLRSKDIGKFLFSFENQYVWYKPELMIKNKKTARPGSSDRFEVEKIIVARMGKDLIAAHDTEGYYVKDGMLLLKKTESTNLKYLTGIINSKFMNYYYKNYFITIDVLKNALLELPIITTDKELTQKIGALVDTIQSLNSRLVEFGDKKTDERARIEEEINKTDAEIDSLVYKIYGLSEEEIKVVEDSLK